MLMREVIKIHQHLVPCPICGNTFDELARGKSRLQKTCSRECGYQRMAQIRRERTMRKDGWIRCSRCHEYREPGRFHLNRCNRTGRQSYCKDCAVLSRDRQIKRKYDRQYRNRAEVRIKARIRETSETYKRKKVVWAREYYRTHLDNYRAWRWQRKARVRSASGNFSKLDWMQLCILFCGQCAYCGERPGITRDHFVPLMRGGKDMIGNVLPACTQCNSSKRDTDPRAWITSKFGPKHYRYLVRLLGGLRA